MDKKLSQLWWKKDYIKLMFNLCQKKRMKPPFEWKAKIFATVPKKPPNTNKKKNEGQQFSPIIKFVQLLESLIYKSLLL